MPRLLLSGLVLCFWYGVVNFCYSAPAPVIAQIDPAHPAVLELSSGETKSVQVSVAAGEFFRIESDADPQLVVKTNLFDPAGKKIATAPSLGGTGGQAIVAGYATAAGVFRLDVQSQIFRPEKRACQVRLITLHSATEQD